MAALVQGLPLNLHPDRIEESISCGNELHPLHQSLAMVPLSPSMIGAFENLARCLRTYGVEQEPDGGYFPKYNSVQLITPGGAKDAFMHTYRQVFESIRPNFLNYCHARDELQEFEHANRARLQEVPVALPNFETMMEDVEQGFFGQFVAFVDADSGIWYFVSKIIQVFWKAFADEVRFRQAIRLFSHCTPERLPHLCLAFHENRNRVLRQLTQGLGDLERYSVALQSIKTYGLNYRERIAAERERQPLQDALHQQQLQMTRAAHIVHQFVVMNDLRPDVLGRFLQQLREANPDQQRILATAIISRELPFLRDVDLSTVRNKHRFIRQNFYGGGDGLRSIACKGFDLNGYFFICIKNLKPIDPSTRMPTSTYDFYVENLHSRTYDQFHFTSQQLQDEYEEKQ